MEFFLYSVVISTLKLGFQCWDDVEICLDLKITMTLNWQHCIKVEVRHHFNVEINLVGFENYNDVELTTSYQRWSLTLTASLFIVKIQYLLYIFFTIFVQTNWYTYNHYISTQVLCNYFLHSSPTLSGTYLNVHLSSFTTNPVKMDIAWWHLQLESKLESN